MKCEILAIPSPRKAPNVEAHPKAYMFASLSAKSWSSVVAQGEQKPYFPPPDSDRGSITIKPPVEILDQGIVYGISVLLGCSCILVCLLSW